MKKDSSYLRKINRRPIWLGGVSPVPHWLARMNGKAQGRQLAARQQGSGWTTTYIIKKTSAYALFCHQEYARCVKLMAPLMAEAAALAAELTLLNSSSSAEVSTAAVASQQAREAERTAGALSACRARRQDIILRLSQLDQLFNEIESLIEQRCAKAARKVEALALAYWGGLMQACGDRDLPCRPELILSDKARLDYEQRHANLAAERRLLLAQVDEQTGGEING